MIETYLLKYLVAIKKFGTLSETSKHLYVSQPALSRSMKKLEEIIGVELFARKKNSIALNDNGKLAAEHAKKILQSHIELIEKVQEFDKKNRTLYLGSCAPVPMNEIIFLLAQNFPDLKISSELGNDEYLLQGLRQDFFNLIILHEKPDEKFFLRKVWRRKTFFGNSDGS